MNDYDRHIANEYRINKACKLAHEVGHTLRLLNIDDEDICRRQMVIIPRGFAEFHFDFETASASLWITVNPEGVTIHRDQKDYYNRTKVRVSPAECNDGSLSLTLQRLF